MLESIVMKEVLNAINLARDAFPNSNIPMPQIKFSNRMTKSGGTCGYKNGLYTVKFSLPIMRENDIAKFASQVAYHEVAHMVDRVVFGGWGHGSTFYHVLRSTFNKSGKEGLRTHSFKTKPTEKRSCEFKYVCERCGEVFNFTSIRHNKAEKAGGRYYSHKCPNGMRGALQYTV